VAFPDDYGHSALAGKTVTMRVKLNSLSTRVLPKADDAFAKAMGQESLDKLRDAVAESLRARMRRQAKAETQQKLMETLLAQVDFPLPEGMVKLREKRIMDDARLRLERHEAATAAKPAGMTADEAAIATMDAKAALENALAARQPEARREAERLTRIHLLLTAVARKENIQASQHEADAQLYGMAMRAGQNPDQLRDAYIRFGLMDELLESIRADKTMDFIYDKAEVAMVAPGAAPSAAEAAPEPANPEPSTPDGA
jgi:trigger factor